MEVCFVGYDWREVIIGSNNGLESPSSKPMNTQYGDIYMRHKEMEGLTPNWIFEPHGYWNKTFAIYDDLLMAFYPARAPWNFVYFGIVSRREKAMVMALWHTPLLVHAVIDKITFNQISLFFSSTYLLNMCWRRNIPLSPFQGYAVPKIYINPQTIH